MSIKKEIDRAVKRIAALDKNTAPKTPAEQEQIISNAEESFNKLAFNFSNATSMTLNQNGKKRLVKQYSDLYSPENILCQCIKQILDRVFKVKYPNRNKISHDLFSTLSATIQMADFTIVKFDFKDYFNSISSIYVFEKYLKSSLSDRHEIDLIKTFVHSTKYAYAGLYLAKHFRSNTWRVKGFISNYGELRYLLDTGLIEASTENYLKNAIDEAFDRAGIDKPYFLMGGGKLNCGYNLYGNMKSNKTILLVDHIGYDYKALVVLCKQIGINNIDASGRRRGYGTLVRDYLIKVRVGY